MTNDTVDTTRGAWKLLMHGESSVTTEQFVAALFARAERAEEERNINADRNLQLMARLTYDPETERERDDALSALKLGGHIRPRDGKACSYLANAYGQCNKCGWSAEARPTYDPETEIVVDRERLFAWGQAIHAATHYGETEGLDTTAHSISDTLNAHTGGDDG